MISKLQQQEGSEQDLDNNKTAIKVLGLWLNESHYSPALYKKGNTKEGHTKTQTHCKCLQSTKWNLRKV